MTWNRMFGHMSLAAAGQQGCWSCLHLLLAGLVLTLQHDILVCHNNSTRHVLVRVIQRTSWTRKRQNCKFDPRYHWYWTGPYWTSKDLVFLCIALADLSLNFGIFRTTNALQIKGTLGMIFRPLPCLFRGCTAPWGHLYSASTTLQQVEDREARPNGTVWSQKYEILIFEHL